MGKTTIQRRVYLSFDDLKRVAEACHHHVRTTISPDGAKLVMHLAHKGLYPVAIELHKDGHWTAPTVMGFDVEPDIEGA